MNIWWIVTPAVAGGALCAALCRSDRDDTQADQRIIIPRAEPEKHPTPLPPEEIPEPGTVLLLGLGLAMMIARKRQHRNNSSKVDEKII
jgi:PEP-CTERM motif